MHLGIAVSILDKKIVETLPDCPECCRGGFNLLSSHPIREIACPWLLALRAAISFRTQIGNSQLLEQVWRGHSAAGVSSKSLLKIGMRERLSEKISRFPNGVIQKYTALAYGFMKLGGDVAGLLFHPIRIGRPGVNERRNIGLRSRIVSSAPAGVVKAQLHVHDQKGRIPI